MSWQDQAACFGTDLDLWFDPVHETKAMSICGRCPVRERCLTDAMNRNAADGIVGGTVPRQRERLAEQMGIRGWPTPEPTYEQSRPCSVLGCDNMVRTRDMCRMHKDRLRRTGTTADPFRPETKLTPEVEAEALHAVVRVAADFGCNLEQVMSDSRLRPHVAARQAAMRELRAMGLSFLVIGKVMGRHHSTVIHAVQKVAA
jgi:WhiB family redox-sensing transcriptional regulator